MLIELQRQANIPGQGMFGKLSVAGFECHTVEREWLENAPGVSCIPAGTYYLKRHKLRGILPTWALVGETVSHRPQAEFKRNYVVIHPANVSSQLQGCVALGSGRTFYKGQYGVSNSKNTVRSFLKVLKESGDQDHVLVIRDPEPICS